MIKFKYKVDGSFAKFMQNQILGFTGGYVLGLLPDYVIGKNDLLRHCSMYLIVESDIVDMGEDATYSNPVAVVARNDVDAVRLFKEYAGEDKCAFVLSTIVDRCDNVKVDPM